MFDIIRRLKPAYALYNFFHRSQLKHNISGYKNIGLKKNYFSPVSSNDFKSLNQSKLSTTIDLSALEKLDAFQQLSAENKESIRGFEKYGYAILRGFCSHEQIDQINAEIDQLLSSKKIQFKYTNKIMFAIYQSAFLRSIGENKDLLAILSALMGREAVLFQSINFIHGSEQRTHSDSIHMTTFPLGGLSACWLALENIGPNQGPLHYYPGSHKLPYYLNSDYGNSGTYFLTGKKTYSEYEDFMQEKIKELGLTKQTFIAAKGDLLIWHANLFHGGEPHHDKKKTRRSMVFHYFAKNVICYHEITQRPALIRKA